MRRLLTILGPLLLLFALFCLVDGMLVETRRLACGHEVNGGMLHRLSPPHACSTANMLAQLQSIRASCRFYMREQRRRPRSIQEVIEAGYMTNALLQDSVATFELASTPRKTTLSAEHPDGFRIDLGLDGRYVVKRDNGEIWHGSDREEGQTLSLTANGR